MKTNSLSLLFIFSLILNSLLAQTDSLQFIKQYLPSKDLNGKPDSVFYYIWNETSGSWKKERRNVYEYSSNKLRYEYVSDWQDSIWLVENKFSYAYNNNLLTKTTKYWWDWFYKEWLYSERKEYNYTEQSHLLDELKLEWSSRYSDWINDSLIAYEYSNGLLTEKANYKWEKSINEWENIAKQAYYYDTLGVMQQQINYTWDFDFENWEAKEKYVNTYDNEKLIEQIMLVPTGKQKSWQNYSKFEHSYTENGLPQKLISYLWVDKGKSSDWLEDKKLTWNYNESDRLLQLTGYIYDWETLLWDEYYLVDNIYSETDYLIETVHYKRKSEEWLNYEMFKYNYPGYIHTSSHLGYLSFNIYPNPANDKVFIEWENSSELLHIDLFDSYGRLVFSNKINGYATQINTSQLNNGIYILKLCANNSVVSRKIVIQK